MDGISLHDTLWNLTVDQLTSYQKLFDYSAQAKNKGAIIDELKRHYANPSKWIQKLGELEKSALAEAAHNWHGEYKQASFMAKYGRGVDFGNPSKYSKNPLCSIGLFFFQQRDGRNAFRIPNELHAEIKSLLNKPNDKAMTSLQEIPSKIEVQRGWKGENVSYPVLLKKTEYASQFELLNVLNLIQAEKLSVSDKTRLPSAAAQKNIDPSLFDGDFFSQVNSSQFLDLNYEKQEEGAVRAFAWSLLIQGGKLAQPFGTKLRLTTKGKAALTEPPYETLKTIWDLWVKCDFFDEFRRIEIVRGQSGKGANGMTDPSERKAAINEGLAELPPNEWVDVDEFFKFLQANSFDFEVTNNPWDLYICEKQYGSLGHHGFHDWKIMEARYILCILFEYAATLGLIDVAYAPAAYVRRDYFDLWGVDEHTFFSRYDGLKYIRLNSFGAYCLDISSNYTPPVLEKRKLISILPNLEIVTTNELGLADKSIMEFLAINKFQLVWVLDEKKILSSLENGKQLPQLKEYLLALSGEAFPPSVDQFFNDLEARISSLKPTGEAQIVTCKDEVVAALIANDSQMKKISVWNNKEYLFIKKNHIGDFKRNLKKMGYAITI